MASAAANLVNTLVELFGVVLLGFLTFRLKLLKPQDIKGISWFVSRWAFPVTLFSVTAVMDFDAITPAFWMTQLMILVVKLVLMIPTYCIALFMNWENPDRYLMAASQLAAVAQSNDVAFGIAITQAVYPEQMVLMGSIAVILDCTVVAILISAFEFGVAKRSAHNDALAVQLTARSSDGGVPGAELTELTIPAVGDLRTGTGAVRLPVPFIVAQKLCKSAIIRGVVLGLLYRLLLSSTLTPLPHGKFALPEPLLSVVNTVKAPYNTLVMFQIGEFLASTISEMSKPGALLLPLVLVVASQILAPALMYLLVGPFTGATGAGLKQLQGFVVMYGLIPASEVAAVFAHVYDIVDTSTSVLFAITTLLSGPLIFLSAVVLENQETTQDFFSLTYKTKAIADVLSLVSLVLFFVTFVLMRRQWQWHKFPTLTAGLFGLVLAMFSLTSLVMHYGGDECTAREKGWYVARQCFRMSIDLLILVFAISVATTKSAGLARAVCLEPFLVATALLVPVLFFIPAGFLQVFSPAKAGLECYEALPMERLFDPVIHALCFLGTIVCLLVSLRGVRALHDEREMLTDVGPLARTISSDTVLMLGTVGTATWALQLILDMTTFQSGAAHFLAYVSLILYNFLGPIMCLMSVMRSDALCCWRSLLRSGPSCWQRCFHIQRPSWDANVVGSAAEVLLIAPAPKTLTGRELVERLQAKQEGLDYSDALDACQQLLEAAVITAVSGANEFHDSLNAEYSVDGDRITDVCGKGGELRAFTSQGSSQA